LLPAQPRAAVLDVRAFGAIPDDGEDDGPAIQAALDALAPNQWLVFPAGTYEHARRLEVRVPGAVLWSDGATLHATNPDDQAVMLQADRASIYNFTLTAETTVRRNAPWQARIAIFERVDRKVPLAGNVIQGNHIVPAGAPGTPTANSASSAGIFVFRAQGFLVAGNEVRRSLADGIHVTAGSRAGRVIGNVVRETGDDMIAMVSYLATGDWKTTTGSMAAEAAKSRREFDLVRNIRVEGNDLEGNYWGRGISVVGGADITVRDNRVAGTAMAAGILLARETSYTTFGVSNVMVEANRIMRIQTDAPRYLPAGWTSAGTRTGQAAIEVHSFVFEDEGAIGALAGTLGVTDIRIGGNTISGSAFNGVRIGEGSGKTSTFTATSSSGKVLSRRFSGGAVGRIELSDARIDGAAAGALLIESTGDESLNVTCSGLSADGAALTDAHCKGPQPTVSGAAIGCY
jgi:hypothetical protein